MPDTNIARFPVPFTDPEVVRHLKDTLNDRMESALAREIATASNAIQDGDPLRYDQWPDTLKAKALYVARVALRMLNQRANTHAELHCREALAQLRFGCGFLRLTSQQQNAVIQDVRCVLDRWYGRMSDRNVMYLPSDVAAAMQPEQRVS